MLNGEVLAGHMLAFYMATVNIKGTGKGSPVTWPGEPETSGRQDLEQPEEVLVSWMESWVNDETGL